MTRYLKCSGCGSQFSDLYKLVRDYPARKSDSEPIPLACPQCKSSGVTFVAYESSGSYH
jgi:DNA-directed RNA polymerase subunit RPC12/RpoP